MTNAIAFKIYKDFRFSVQFQVRDDLYGLFFYPEKKEKKKERRVGYGGVNYHPDVKVS